MGHTSVRAPLRLLNFILQVEHHSLLCRQIKDANGAELQSYVVTNTPRVEFRLRQAVAQAANASPAAAAAGSAAGANGLQPFKVRVRRLGGESFGMH